MFEERDFPPDTQGKPFPLVEVNGFYRTLPTKEAEAAFSSRYCPFSKSPCEKILQYGYGYCSVTYRTDDDDKYYTYAVCDHRLDGAPVQQAIDDYFGLGARVDLVPEVVLTKPRESFDYVAIERSDNPRFIAIETQAIDLRGGGVGPAWRALQEGNPREWRRYFTEEAGAKGRQDTVAYGVNTANIYKRLGLQIAVKGALLSSIGSKLYVVCQDRPFEYLRTRIPFTETAPEVSDLVFLTFGYSERPNARGALQLVPVREFRTSIAVYSSALTQGRTGLSREGFLEAVRRKLRAGVPSIVPTPAPQKGPRKRAPRPGTSSGA